VKPVANIPHLLPSNVPQILINRESLKHMNFDVELLGDCDVIVNELLLRLEEKRKQRQTVFRDEQNEEQKELNELKWSDICNERILLNKIENDEADRFLLPTNSNVRKITDVPNDVQITGPILPGTYSYFELPRPDFTVPYM
jgi:NAD-dependent deacetylase sirtuin 1